VVFSAGGDGGRDVDPVGLLAKGSIEAVCHVSIFGRRSVCQKVFSDHAPRGNAAEIRKTQEIAGRETG